MNLTDFAKSETSFVLTESGVSVVYRYDETDTTLTAIVGEVSVIEVRNESKGLVEVQTRNVTVPYTTTIHIGGLLLIDDEPWKVSSMSSSSKVWNTFILTRESVTKKMRPTAINRMGD